MVTEKEKKNCEPYNSDHVIVHLYMPARPLCQVADV